MGGVRRCRGAVKEEPGGRPEGSRPAHLHDGTRSSASRPALGTEPDFAACTGTRTAAAVTGFGPLLGEQTPRCAWSDKLG